MLNVTGIKLTISRICKCLNLINEYGGPKITCMDNVLGSIHPLMVTQI
jgi:hypothetical protein